MHSLGMRRDELRRDRVENEAAKAIRFAESHGAWPLGMTPAASAAILQRTDAERLQREWGDLVAHALLDMD